MHKDQRHGFVTTQSDKNRCTALRSNCRELLCRCAARGQETAPGGVWYTSLFFTLHSSTMARCSDRTLHTWKSGKIVPQVKLLQLFSPTRPSRPSWSSSRDAHVLSLFFCLSPFHVLDFKAYFASPSRSRMSKILEIRNLWGKVLERSGLRIEHFCWEVV